MANISNREIADLAGKQHTNVLVDSEEHATLNFQLNDFPGSYIDGMGRSLPCFNLPKRDILILVSGYSVTLVLQQWWRRRRRQRDEGVVC